MYSKKERTETVLTKVKKMRERAKKSFLLMGGVILFTMTQVQATYAADIGKNVQIWISDQIFWIGLAVLGFILVTNLLKHNTIGALITGVVGGVILFFVKNPERLSNLGEQISNNILKL